MFEKAPGTPLTQPVEPIGASSAPQTFSSAASCCSRGNDEGDSYEERRWRECRMRACRGSEGRQYMRRDRLKRNRR